MASQELKTSLGELLRVRDVQGFTFPTSAMEDWHYTPVKLIENQTVTHISTFDDVHRTHIQKPSSDLFELAFVNGIYIEKYSNISTSDFIQFEVSNQNQTPEASSFFKTLNNTFATGEIKLKVAMSLTKPIVIRHHYNIQTAHFMASPRIYIEAKKGTSFEIVEIFEDGSEQEYFVNDRIKFNLEDNSNVCYMRFVNESEKSVHLGHVEVNVARDAYFESVVIGKGAKISRHDQSIIISGQGGRCNLLGLSLLQKQNRMEQNISIRHAQAHTTSQQNFKSILYDKSHFVFQGKVNIKSIAQGASAHQINRNLILGEKARVDTKPQLDIYADDVQATHGATVGQLDPEELFYMQSRGFSPDESVKIVCEGYGKSVFETVSGKWIKNKILEWFSKEMQGALNR